MFEKFFKRSNPDQKLVFIVEDNETYAKLLKSFIQTNFPEIKEIKIFLIGEMCLTELYRNPGLIIMDYSLNTAFKPAYNGLEMIKRIKASNPNTNIIALSAQEKFDVMSTVIKEYGCSYVQKGEEAFRHVELLIKTILSKQSSSFSPSPA